MSPGAIPQATPQNASAGAAEDLARGDIRFLCYVDIIQTITLQEILPQLHHSRDEIAIPIALTF